MTLCETVTHWITSIDELINLLDSEFEALKQKNREAIENIATQKADKLAQFQTLEKNIHEQLALTISDSSLSFSQKLSLACPTLCLDTLKQQANLLQQNNQRNGMLLQGMIRLNEYGLALLSGKSEGSTTYDAGGQVQQKQHSLSKLATA